MVLGHAKEQFKESNGNIPDNEKRSWVRHKIRSGEKKIEYRMVKPYWTKRLRNFNGDTIIFKNGYGKNAPEIKKKFIEFIVTDGMNTDLKINKLVYAIFFDKFK